jgi:citrate/tricarballylate utilization protein
MPDPELFGEANRQLTICNSCRYCEGYCPVFRAIETRRDFSNGDVLYLANLCHDCRACFYACMYTPPHEFAINIPKLLTEVRIESYRRWAWPVALSRVFQSRWLGAAMAFAAFAVVVVLAVTLLGPARILVPHFGPGAFYQVVPYLVMVIGGTVLFFYWIGVWTAGGVRYWSESGNVLTQPGGLRMIARAIADAFALPYLQGGGPGCYYPQARPSASRRVYHTLTSWGFLSALISTSIAAIYQELFHWMPPFSLTSAPVVFGSVGGVAMIIGTAGLIWIKMGSDAIPRGDGASGMDYLFLINLGLTSLSGMLTLILRSTSALGITLVIHLGLVAALFVTAPYGKFVHLVYRVLALVRYRIERNQIH